jgi:hypothetical protein
VARIVTVYAGYRRAFVPTDMSYIRWLAMSEALAGLGHEVDIATREPGVHASRFPVRMGPRLRRVPLSRVRWDRYDVVKTEHHTGFETLWRRGGADHPWIISNLGSVVDREDCDNVYFYGARRRELFAVQKRIAARSRCVTLITDVSRQRWRRNFGDAGNPFVVPGAADDRVPAPGPDPYGAERRIRCLIAGNIYDPVSQPEAHATLVGKINALGGLLLARDVRLHLMGLGDTSRLDHAAVTYLGAVPYERSWDYLHHAHVGLVLALGPHPNENESTKIYYYLRVGLPTVCEAGFPNQDLVVEARLGRVAPNGDLTGLADAIASTARASWDKAHAIELIRARHTWSHRARLYEDVIRAAVS